MQASASRLRDHVFLNDVPAKSSYAKKGYRWKVETRIAGKRSRRFFKHGEAEERDTHVAEQEELIRDMDKDQRPQALDRSLQRELQLALKALAPWSASLTEAAEFYAAHLKTKQQQDGTTIETAIAHYLDSLYQRELDPKTINRSRQTLNRFSTAFPERTLASLTGEEIQLWWEGYGGIVNQRANRTDVNTFLNWCVRSPKFAGFTVNLTPSAPELPKKRAPKRILTMKEVKGLLNHANEELLPAIVAQVFIGVRKEESLRLRWEHFDWEENTLSIPAEIAKGGANHARINEIPENALEWLAPYRGEETGRVLSTLNTLSSYDNALQSLRGKAGWDDSNPWPRNALRRTFISCHYASFSNVGLTASLAGTSEGVIFRNYRAVMKKSLAQKLWDIRPTKSNRKVVSMRKAS